MSIGALLAGVPINQIDWHEYRLVEDGEMADYQQYAVSVIDSDGDEVLNPAPVRASNFQARQRNLWVITDADPVIDHP